MIKLRNDENKCIWIYGTTGRTYIAAAKKATGKSKMCPAVRRVMAVLAEQALETAITAGYTQLYTVESLNMSDVVVNISLPACLYDAINVVKSVCSNNGVNF